LAKPGNFDEVRDRKVVDAWLAEMDDYLHATKVGRHSAVVATPLWAKWENATPTPKSGDFESSETPKNSEDDLRESNLLTLPRSLYQWKVLEV
jgi:hypothetical protein